YAQTTGPRQKYAGMEQDEATGMSHTLWREFDSLSARWTAPDPYGGSMDPGSPQSFNRYTYCNNDPVNKVDPAGLMLIDIGVVQVNSAGEASQLHFLSVHNFRYSVNKDYRDQYDARVKQEQLEKEEREKGERKSLAERSNEAFLNGLKQSGKDKFKDYFGPPPDPVPSIDPCNPALLTSLDADVQYVNAARSRDLYAPEFATRFSAAIREMNAAGIVPTINQSFRTAADQQRMVDGASGSNPAAAVGYSLHETGNAVDINGTRSPQFAIIREIMERHGFTWGGRWPNRPDRPHFELNPFGPKGARGTPQRALWLSRVHDAAVRASGYYNQCFIQVR
ncbi:MAG TPA: RHS repeat-associated core domain-containing protein, partial [Pyrinomonadaceae bacterium]